MVRETLALVAIVTIGINLFKAPVSIEAMTLDERAQLAGMSTTEFVLMSSVVESESNRCQDDTTGRRYIALCILCRVRDSRFPSTIEGVLTQSGQFSTVVRSNGAYHAVTNRTDLSDRAVIEAVEWMNSGEEYPWLLFFNCRGYFSWREAYNPDRNGDGIADGAIGGNYFSL